ncbi:flagellar transcriptional regulator FlhD [Tatumella saanichensis]|uniref:flagellar transcriptional regulator FlhD n=1 Tax=Tatumella saanichensis TaxID=480813 RepID=UPI0004AE3331|nr:flagellar transcriptional regulator FlhD [Tatumella saanichensis]
MECHLRLKNIYECNLSYLLLARQLLAEDWPTALYRLGLSDDMATALVELSPTGMIRLAETGQLICQLRISDVEDVRRMSRSSRIDGLQPLYNDIMLASKGTVR